MQIAGSVVVITGASSGIGRALAVECGLRGAKVVIAARSLQKLEETAGIVRGYGAECSIMEFDITSEVSLRKLLNDVLNTYSRIDIFVNNAGVGLFENTALATQNDIAAVFETNFWGPLRAMQALMPLMRAGTIVNVSSAASAYSPSRQGVYAASKAALNRVTEAVGIEEASRLNVLLVLPDRTATPFMEHVRGPKENTKLGLKLGFASAEAVAKRIAHAISRDKSICYTTVKGRIYSILGAVTPGVMKRVIQRTSE